MAALNVVENCWTFPCPSNCWDFYFEVPVGFCGRSVGPVSVNNFSLFVFPSLIVETIFLMLGFQVNFSVVLTSYNLALLCHSSRYKSFTAVLVSCPDPTPSWGKGQVSQTWIVGLGSESESMQLYIKRCRAAFIGVMRTIVSLKVMLRHSFLITDIIVILYPQLYIAVFQAQGLYAPVNSWS